MQTAPLSVGMTWGRSAAAAVGAAIGGLAAVLVGGPLFAWLFIHVGGPIAGDMISGATEGRSGIEGALVGLFVVIAAVIVAVLVVAALVAPVFVLLPLGATAFALRLAKAGLILRSLWLTIAAVAGLAAVRLMLFHGRPAITIHASSDRQSGDLHLPHFGPGGWTWILIIAGGAFAGRLVVELWRPAQAAQPDPVTALAKPWQRLVRIWVGILVLVVVVVLVTVVAFWLLAGGPA
ncbi:hypothetical protein AB0I34_22240 [Kribbella sp. NPDC050281]|uniref:hypothetical protein n=1 Tax=Kribbella sp. NPDC050281 TaxID=3155515 RepID=UPI003404F772